MGLPRLPRWTVLAVGASLLVPACAATTPPARPGTLEYTEKARAVYERALEAAKDRDWEAATALLNEVKRDYAQTRYARLAELRLADIAYEEDKLPEAISAYRTFIQAHRYDPGLVYAHYRVCKSLYGQITESLLLPPQEERDQSAALDAWKEIRRFRAEYPGSEWDGELDYMLQAVTGRLVRHELYVARFYLVRAKFEPAVARLQYALKTYENSGLEPEAMVLLGETYLKMKKRAEAREVFQRVVAVYPDSPFVAPAQSFIARIDSPDR